MRPSFPRAPPVLPHLLRKGDSHEELACVALSSAPPTLTATESSPAQDPKDGELCVVRAKSGEPLMEALSDTDVQIVRQHCVYGANY